MYKSRPNRRLASAASVGYVGERPRFPVRDRPTLVTLGAARVEAQGARRATRGHGISFILVESTGPDVEHVCIAPLKTRTETADAYLGSLSCRTRLADGHVHLVEGGAGVRRRQPHPALSHGAGLQRNPRGSDGAWGGPGRRGAARFALQGEVPAVLHLHFDIGGDDLVSHHVEQLAQHHPPRYPQSPLGRPGCVLGQRHSQ